MAFRKIGGLWLKRDRRGRQYLTGAFFVDGEKVHVSIYMNEKKEAENQPEWLVYEQKLDKKYLKK